MNLSVAEAVQRRRALRVLSSDPLTDDEIRMMAESARLAPSCNNNQPWNLIAVSGKDNLDALKGCLPRGNSWALRAPLIFAVCSQPADDCELSDRRDYHLFDCGLAIGELLLCATAMGIIAHPIAGYDPEKAKEVLGIPPNHILITLVICARPGTDDSMLSEKQLLHEGERPSRRPAEENFFEDVWGKPLRM